MTPSKHHTPTQDPLDARAREALDAQEDAQEDARAQDASSAEAPAGEIGRAGEVGDARVTGEAAGAGQAGRAGVASRAGDTGDTGDAGKAADAAASARRGARVTLLPSPPPEPDAEPEADLGVDLAGVKLPNPVLAASGTFGFGREMAGYVDLSQVGAVVTKSVSAAPRRGRPTPRMAETPSGMLNAIGLQNPGVEAYCSTELPFLAAAGARVVASIFGHTAAEFGAVAARLATEPAIDLLEVNLSCPNVEHHGRLFAADPEATATVVREVKERAGVPVLAKLSADVTDIVPVAAAAVDAGADGLVLINTVLGMAVDVRRRRPKLAAVTGGLSGPAIRPIALRCVWQVVQSLPGVPVVGAGGIASAEDAAEFLLVGATAVAVGTASLVNPTATAQITGGLADYLRTVGVDSVAELPSTFTRW